MKTIIQKIGLKEQEHVLVIDAPKEFLEQISSFAYDDSANKIYEFIISFAYSLQEAQVLAKALIDHYEPGGHLWMCYPKTASKNIKSDIKRGNITPLYAEYGYEPVTQVSVNDDWSAMRFRHVSQIKSMKRSFAVTEEGKKKAKEGKRS